MLSAFNVGKMVDKMLGLVAVSLILCICSAEEACHSFGGGHVYPGEPRTSGEHGLHLSKTQSKCEKQLHM